MVSLNLLYVYNIYVIIICIKFILIEKYVLSIFVFKEYKMSYSVVHFFDDESVEAVS